MQGGFLFIGAEGWTIWLDKSIDRGVGVGNIDCGGIGEGASSASVGEAAGLASDDEGAVDVGKLVGVGDKS